MLNLVPSSMLLRPASTQPPRRPPAQSQDHGGSSTAKKDSETLDGCLDGSTHKEIQLHGTQDLPTTEGSTMPHGRDVPAPVNTLERVKKATMSSAERATEAKRSYKPHPGTQTGDAQPLLDFSPLKDPIFYIFTWSFLFCHLAYFVPTFHLVARARTLGISSMDASYLVSVAGRQKESFKAIYNDTDTQIGNRSNTELAKK